LERADIIILPPLLDDQADLEGSMQLPAEQRHFATPLRHQNLAHLNLAPCAITRRFRIPGMFAFPQLCGA
jgi:hypothetical protein